MSRKPLQVHPQTLAYLVDKDGTVHDTYTTDGEDPASSVEAMNATAKAASDGRLWWTLEPPSQPHSPTE